MTLVLLPPSEGKTDGTLRKRLDVGSLAHPELGAARERVLDAVAAVAAGSVSRARTVLGVTKGQDAEIARDTRLRTAPTGCARDVYSGVLFDAVGFASLSQRALRRLDNTVLVQSALFGVLSLADLIPAYRLSAGTVLPKVGSLTTMWAPLVTPIIAAHEGLVVDMRSGSYVALGPLPAGCHAVVPRVLQRVPGGPPKVITHSNKATKGRILRAMATTPKAVATVDELAELVAGLGADVDLRSAKGRIVLDVVVAAP